MGIVARIAYELIIRSSAQPSLIRIHTGDTEQVPVQVAPLRAVSHPPVRPVVLPLPALLPRRLGGEFMLSARRDVSAAKRFFKKMMRAEHRRLPFSISVGKNAAYPEAFSTSQEERIVPRDCKLRRVKYLNNVIEQDHRFIKKKVRASQCFKSFHTAERTLEGIEAMNMMRKGQVKRLSGNDAQGQAKFIASLFGIAT